MHLSLEGQKTLTEVVVDWNSSSNENLHTTSCTQDSPIHAYVTRVVLNMGNRLPFRTCALSETIQHIELLAVDNFGKPYQGVKPCTDAVTIYGAQY